MIFMPLGIDITVLQGDFPYRTSGVEYEGEKRPKCPGRKHCGPFKKKKKM
jgi:hypothetical protein